MNLLSNPLVIASFSVGFAAGWGLSHPALLVDWAFRGIGKLPGGRAWVQKHATDIKATAEATLTRVGEDVDAEAAKPQP